ncbi:hypothetical protein IP86_10200 [Rhodopseudomonas sp. AAP120]|uniref:PepSY-associated TM helix domain-containing protein n=1 Tax=Rhodopseudomonas sp. AAP120 TaxID=1523430 RepID=UPI0006CD10E5|nr:PepSY-associated TM helix domain-containing protein [Rhodopseudomonas sp. AAP120]KPF99008.1 hypothetical protein IP86_10200 [Rhodopseudomonas sp. AAP120]
MRRATLLKWLWIHKWSSLICTVFLLLICVTGLPLVFEDEIADLFDDALPYAAMPSDAARVDLDRLIAKSRAAYPDQTVMFAVVGDDEPKVVVSLAPSWAAFQADRRSMRQIRFDARTGDVLKNGAPLDGRAASVMNVVRQLHVDLFAGLPGELFLGAMGLLFVVAIVSGAVVYGPFMRRLEFATIRSGRSRRLKWLDLHNLLGVVPLVWLLVVGVTGVINELSKPMFSLWQMTEVRAMLASFAGSPIPAQPSSPRAALEVAEAATPGMTPVSVTFPGSPFGSPYHYIVWTKGHDPLTSRLFKPVLVDARNGKLAAVVQMPWYLTALQVSRPLHFGDYGGMPLKIIWALLDCVTIVILGSGLYLWWARRGDFAGAAGIGPAAGTAAAGRANVLSPGPTE